MYVCFEDWHAEILNLNIDSENCELLTDTQRFLYMLLY